MSENTTAREETLYSICLLAVFSDGGRADAEREELREIGASLLPPEFNAAGIYQKVLLRKTTVAEESAKLDAPEWRRTSRKSHPPCCRRFLLRWTRNPRSIH